jgi:hypothetical protein
MTKLLQHRAATISFVVTDELGSPVDATANPTVVVTDGAGTTIASGTSSKPVGTTGPYEFGLTPAHTAVLDTYQAVWSYTRAGNAEQATTSLEVVGAFYFSVAEARAFDNGAMADPTRYPAATIVAGRELVEEHMEQLCGVAFVPRATRVVIDGTDDEVLVALTRPRVILSASIDDVALTAGQLSNISIHPEGRLVYPSWMAGDLNIRLHVVHGHDAPPEPIKRAALVLLRNRLVASNVDDRAISFTDELGTRQLAVAGRRGQPTGIPDVDAAIAQYTERAPIAG